MDEYKELEEKFEKLEKELGDAKALIQKMKEQESKTWKPYLSGYYITGDTDEISTPSAHHKNHHNCFRTKELAVIRQKQRQAEDELFNIWEHLVGDWRPDLTGNNRNYFLYYEVYDNEIQITYNTSTKYLSIYYYFPNEQLAMKQYEMASDNAKAYIRGEF